MITQLKRTPALYLVGFMGAGKTVIGRLVAERLGWRFVDLDDDIEAREKSTISAIFDERGEEDFRRIETAALRARIGEVECGRPTVIALGGGAFAQPENFVLLMEHGIVIWLDCPLEVVRRRVAQATHRPLARDPEQFEQLFHARRQTYRRAHHAVPITSDDPAMAAEAILRLPIFK